MSLACASGSMSRSHTAVRGLVLALAALSSLAGCRQHPGTAPDVVATAPASAAGPAAAPQGKTQMTDLDEVLALFTSTDGTRWAAYDALPRIAWRDAAPVENDGVADAALRFSRSGQVLLAGFGEAALPDGGVGPEAGARMGNEGEAGLTLNGDAERVNEVAVVKFHPDEHYAGVLAAQFPAATVAEVADQCVLDAYGAENVQKTAFYRVASASETIVYVEAFVDEDAGPASPGTTTFVFTRDLPLARIAAMRCRQR